tara:strand:- start:1727 stop:2167 length:441 start_codon:yes stop_codon:yes gene_type:complete
MKNSNKKPIVYCAMSGDIIHHGHINILKIAKKYGEIVLGILTDKAISSYKEKPIFNYNQRKMIFENIKCVKKIVPQNTHDYTKNLKKIRPDYVVHGNDWKKGVQKKVRDKVLKVIKKWNGKLIEPKYTKNISSSLIKKRIRKKKWN